jgi:hypothetical protein
MGCSERGRLLGRESTYPTDGRRSLAYSERVQQRPQGSARERIKGFKTTGVLSEYRAAVRERNVGCRKGSDLVPGGSVQQGNVGEFVV